ncbi:MAG TPA: (d)CMP kinase [Firmicutes bacterium]|nr:(d)CMP kinase [Bacillota bacterium]
MAQRGKGKDLVIAIDGPAGAGKSTIARLVAARLGLRYIDTGAMYRALTLKALRSGVDCDDAAGLIELLARSKFEFPVASSPENQAILLDGEDVSAQIRLPEVSQKVSRVAMVPQVRRELVRSQRELAAQGGIVMDGRDIGTVVLPEADIKIFLTASLEERARRRFLELQQKGIPATLDEVKREIAARDKLDAEREVSPLQAAPDAVIIDTTALTPAEVVAQIIHLCCERGEG